MDKIVRLSGCELNVFPRAAEDALSHEVWKAIHAGHTVVGIMELPRTGDDRKFRIVSGEHWGK